LTAEYSPNVIAERLYSQVNNEGNQFLLLDEIIDWKMTDVVKDENVSKVSQNGNIHRRRTTKGWKVCVRWKDQSTSWEPLKDLKEEARYLKHTHKYGIQLPKTVEEAYDLDCASGTDL